MCIILLLATAIHLFKIENELLACVYVYLENILVACMVSSSTQT